MLLIVTSLVTERRQFYFKGFCTAKQRLLFLSTLLCIHISGTNMKYSALSGILVPRFGRFIFGESIPSSNWIGSSLVRISKAGVNMVA